MDTEDQINQFLAPYSDDLKMLVRQIRKYLVEKTRPSMELIGDTYQSLNFGYGFTDRAWDCYCAIILYRKHLNISFPSGTLLTDPDGFLHGSGSRIRHLKVKEFDDLTSPAVISLLLEARENAFAQVDHVPSIPKTVKTIIKPVSGKKRRPK